MSRRRLPRKRLVTVEPRIVTQLIERNEMASRDVDGNATTLQWDRREFENRERPDPPIASLFDDPEEL